MLEKVSIGPIQVWIPVRWPGAPEVLGGASASS